MFSIKNGRDQRSRTHFNPIHMHNPYANYCTEALQKSEMKLDYENELFLNNLHLIRDPLQKNLADTLITSEIPDKVKKHSLEVPIMPPQQRHDEVRPESALAGITNFFSGVFSMLSGAMFRTKSPVDFYDCFDAESRQGSPLWQRASADEQDKNGLAADKASYDASLPNVFPDMNKCKTTVSSCEDKLNQVKCLLSPKDNKPASVWLRKRPKKVFVEPGTVEENFEDAFAPEDFVPISNELYIEYQCPPQLESETLCETVASKTKLEVAPIIETTEIVTETKDALNIVNNDQDVPNNIGKSESQELKPENHTMKLDIEEVKPENQTNYSETDEVKLEMPNTTIDEVKPETQTTENPDDKHEIITSCEDKLLKLKALLQEKRKKTTKPTPEPTPETLKSITEQPKPATELLPPVITITDHPKPATVLLPPVITTTEQPKPATELPPSAITISEQPKPAKTIPICKPVDKHFKNPHRMIDKRRKMKMKRSILDDVVFANEIDTASSVENSPSTPSTITSSDTSLGEYFDELKGRFRSTSATESEDSFQIVFNDSPKLHRASDCESEDSFIVFEDDCYTSNDVFGDSDSDSDVSDSGCSTMTCKLSHSLSRTVSNLTDDTLYESNDEVDCAKVERMEARGLLIDADRKKLKKDQPPKQVRFSTDPPQVKVLRVWAYAARQARAGHWERYALDRDRFKRRIADADVALSWVLKPQHRSRIMFQRFMPWWNRERRRELTEKREREARRKEEERLAEEKRIEDERIAEEKRIEDERIAEEKRIEDERIAEEERLEEEKRRIEDEKINGIPVDVQATNLSKKFNVINIPKAVVTKTHIVNRSEVKEVKNTKSNKLNKIASDKIKNIKLGRRQDVANKILQLENR